MLSACGMDWWYDPTFPIWIFVVSVATRVGHAIPTRGLPWASRVLPASPDSDVATER